MSGAESMPALFVGHGNPMNALEQSAWSEAWAELAAAVPRPRAILAVSAHWYVAGTRVTAEARPRTIHDFGGFPPELYQVEYPAPGSPALAERVRELLGPTGVELDSGWGFDHGTWSVLAHMFPSADVPVVQLGIDKSLSARQHFELAGRLRPLRREGILLLGSGNVVHNLRTYAWRRRPVEPYDWAVEFESQVRNLLAARDFDRLADYEHLAGSALAAPTPEHFLPLLYTTAPCSAEEPVSFPVAGFDGGSVSMLAVQIG